PDPVCHLCPEDLEALGVEPGGMVTLETRRNVISAYARADSQVAKGHVFMAFCYYEAAANLLTNPTLDPEAKIPSLKYCGVRVSAGGNPQELLGYRVPEKDSAEA